MADDEPTDSPEAPDAPIRCGPFELIEPIGEGGMGWVWRGRYVGPGEAIEVAVKVLGKLGLPTDRDRELFHREVQAQAGLNHPGVAVVYDYGELDEGVDEASGGRLEPGAPYIAMEYAERGTLVDGGWPSNWAASRTLLLELLDALGHAHSRGVVHRDLKPDNILVFPDDTSSGRWKLTDFGIAHATHRVRKKGTRQVSTPEAGTPHYMAPEQFFRRWREFGPWTDLYQLGCVAYELICGQLPFDESSLPAFAKAHAEEPFPPLEPRFPVPETLESWVRQMTAKAPGDRFVRAADAARALSALDDGELVGELEIGEGKSIGTVTTLQPEELTHEAADDRETATYDSSDGGPDTMAMWGGVDAEPEPPEVGGLGGRSIVELQDYAFPTDWRLDRSDDRSRQLTGAGLGLFDLREVPFVDRTEERDRIWAKLRDAAERERPIALEIEGASGTGKSRLAQWMVRRADELGAATVWRATHDRQGGPGTDLRGMFERWLSTWDLDREAVEELAERRLRTYAPGADPSRSRTLEGTATDLAAFLRPDDPGDEPESMRFQSEQSRYAALARVLQTIAGSRPVVVWLDDVQWADRSVSFVEHVLDHPRCGPVLFMLTRRPADGVGGLERNGRSIGESRPAIETLELAPLGDEDHAAFVEQLLPLKDRLVDEICQLSAGNPMFAEQLVREWVAEEALRVGSEGYRLRAEVEQDVPAQMHDLWMHRIESAIDALPEGDSRDSFRALELAAALGRQIDRAEWRAACQEADYAPADGLVEQLGERGLVEFESELWAFAHSMLVETLERFARAGGRWQDHHLACARMLAGDAVRRTGNRARREAHHRIGADEPTAALGPLLEAAEWAGERGAYRREARDLERRAELMDEIGLPDEIRERVENRARYALNCLRRGEFEEAESYASRSRDIAKAEGWPTLEAESLVALAGVDQDRGDDAATAERLEAAQRLFDSAGDEQGVARCRRRKGLAYRRVGDFERAEDYFQRAKRDFEAIDDPVGRLRCNSALMWTLSGRDNLEEAESVAAQVIREARELRASDIEASGWNLRGDIAKLRGRYGSARDYYQRAVELSERSASRKAVVVALNRTMVEIADRDFEAASATLASLDEQLREAGFSVYTAFVHLARAARAASRTDWETWSGQIASFEAALSDYDATPRDLAWFAEVVADITDEHDGGDRAQRLLADARDLWTELGDRDAVARVERRLSGDQSSS